MKQPENICKVYRAIADNVGKRVKIKFNKGSNQYDISEGIISKAYPCVFLVQLDKNSSEAVKIISYSYTDVLTKEVELQFC